MGFKLLIFTLLLSSVLAHPEPEPGPLPEEVYDNYEYEEEPVDYGEVPEFVYPEPQTITGVEGGKVIIPCKLSTMDSPYVLIVKKQKSDTEEEQLLFADNQKLVRRRSRRYKLNQGMMEMSRLQASDSGNYVCRLQVDPPIEVVHYVDVQFAPKITHHSPEEQQVVKDESVKLECEANGNPTPTIRWSREDGHLPSGAEEEEGLSMTLEGVDRHVEGTYICTADNGIGDPASASMAITVSYKPEIITEKTTVRTGEGDKVELVCIVHARPAPQVVWSKDGQPIDEPGQVEEHDKGHRHSLQINGVTENDFGKYECLATNDLGTASAPIHLTGYPKHPKVTSDPNGGEETSYTLTWETESYYPILEYRLRYRRAKANDSTDLPGDWEEATYEAKEIETEGLVHRMKHTLEGLQPATDYHAAIQVKNKFNWSANAEYAFSTKKEVTGHQMTDGAPLCSLSTVVFLLPTLLLLRT
ncbi:limbic system-associated membrane protein-like isoform X2 [Portunus trituberculatus]|uniref:limbic system-associated membrane protein-like isoform X2 n=1 Tax=Portunus trituberculatus TaxID=210409 RepID=UPI001E1D149A|nr:limbic system-associated membrane protein-like isoform X2 [Portunus trituberculatus]